MGCRDFAAGSVTSHCRGATLPARGPRSGNHRPRPGSAAGLPKRRATMARAASHDYGPGEPGIRSKPAVGRCLAFSAGSGALPVVCRRLEQPVVFFESKELPGAGPTGQSLRNPPGTRALYGVCSLKRRKNTHSQWRVSGSTALPTCRTLIIRRPGNLCEKSPRLYAESGAASRNAPPAR